MIRKTALVISLLSATLTLAATAENRLPEFSWDTVPRYMHVRKYTAFTPDEIKYLAKFPLITLEKTTGSRDSGSTEAGTLKAAKAIKQVNPDSKILYYRNIIVHYGSYAADSQLKKIDQPFLSDPQGGTNLVRGKVPAYDLTQPKVQQWWLDHAREVCASDSIDGLFVDGNIKALEERYLLRQIGKDKRSALTAAYHQMMKQLPEKLGKDKLVIANIIRARFPRAGVEYLDYFDGSYIEGFEHAVGRSKREDYMAKGIAAIQKAARSGKIIAFTIGLGPYTDTDMDAQKAKTSNKTFKSAHDRFLYTLALFLVCAEPHSYFMLADGYGVDNGRSRLWMKDYPEYSYPLGAPKGPAQRDGYSYRRDFEHASVTVDIESETAEILWKKKPKPSSQR
ncbi:hypothetical protein JO972_12845 [Verrucomicrobiaceae bacterium 5K15]|uniref:Glycoside hydrolase n=1 Tax=Oceaniferula flava TaxID=2800421 RepID=A0AAE2VD92_9BACT|nr:putative glycoside hydrolase [Oceaniferula flavus]MBK1855851.1 hypothetical protein [Oceaniferula flavus]MBM1137158.1 hypothetical protein [Oceaniferula flavus]